MVITNKLIAKTDKYLGYLGFRMHSATQIGISALSSPVHNFSTTSRHRPQSRRIVAGTMQEAAMTAASCVPAWLQRSELFQARRQIRAHLLGIAEHHVGGVAQAQR